MWWTRHSRPLVPQPISDPLLRPVVDAPVDQREVYAVYTLGNFFPWTSREQMLGTHASLWEAFVARCEQRDLSTCLGLQLLANTDSHARTRARTADRLAAMAMQSEQDAAEVELLADTQPELQPLATEYDMAMLHDKEEPELQSPQRSVDTWPLEPLDLASLQRIRNHVLGVQQEAQMLPKAQQKYVAAARVPLAPSAADDAQHAVLAGDAYTAEALSRLHTEVTQTSDDFVPDAAPLAAPSSVRRLQLYDPATRTLGALAWYFPSADDDGSTSHAWPSGKELPFVRVVDEQRPTPEDAATLFMLSGDQHRAFELIAYTILLERVHELPGTGKTALVHALVWFTLQ